MTDQSHEPAHYARGPSSADRWLICTDSPEAQAGYPDTTGDPADEGTAAHWLLEQCLLAGQDVEEWLDAGHASSYGRVVPAGEETGCLKDWPTTGEMIEAVQLAIDTVKPDVEKKGTRLFVEERVRVDGPLGLSEKVGGTADIMLYLPRSKVLKVLDFKYGKGKVVEIGAAGNVYQVADDGSVTEVPASQHLGFDFNPQLGIYGLGAAAELDRLLGEHREVKWVELTVIQPRAYHKKGPVRRKKLSPLQFMALEMRLVDAVNGERKRVAGDHCGFCRAKHDCETFAAVRTGRVQSAFAAEAPAPAAPPAAEATPEATHQPPAVQQTPEVAAVDMQTALSRPPSGLTVDQLAALRPHIKPLRDWLKAVEEEVRNRLLYGIDVPNVRLAQGRGKREFGGDPAEVTRCAQELVAAGIVGEDAVFEPRKVRSVAQIEKAAGKSAFNQSSLGQLVTSIEGGPVVVDADSDKPAYSPNGGFEAEAPPAETPADEYAGHPLL